MKGGEAQRFRDGTGSLAPRNNEPLHPIGTGQTGDLGKHLFNQGGQCPPLGISLFHQSLRRFVGINERSIPGLPLGFHPEGLRSLDTGKEQLVLQPEGAPPLGEEVPDLGAGRHRAAAGQNQGTAGNPGWGIGLSGTGLQLPGQRGQQPGTAAEQLPAPENFREPDRILIRFVIRHKIAPPAAFRKGGHFRQKRLAIATDQTAVQLHGFVPALGGHELCDAAFPHGGQGVILHGTFRQGHTVHIENPLPDGPAIGGQGGTQDGSRNVQMLQRRVQDGPNVPSGGGVKGRAVYCSTFDSTPRGNIGPILDAALEHLHVPASILCPALPANGRTVREGILYVNGVPLAESPMKDHPLTPMWESRITKLMAPQSRYEAMELHGSLIRGNRQTLLAEMAAFSEGRRGCYFVPDYETDQDAVRLAEIFGSWKLLSGGSGLLTALARQLKPGAGKPYPPSGVPGSALILAGSCSVATRAQIRHFLSQGGRALRLEDELLLSGVQTPETLWMEAKGQAGDAPLIYAYETPEGLMEKRNPQGRALSALIEQVLSQVARLACADGVKRLIVAGGETSGAVTKALGFTAFQIGESIAPGVPILIPLERPDIRLVLKSGNFGQEDFFQRVLDVTKA